MNSWIDKKDNGLIIEINRDVWVIASCSASCFSWQIAGMDLPLVNANHFKLTNLLFILNLIDWSQVFKQMNSVVFSI